MTDAVRDHRIDYIELPATDIGATRRFYEAAFGWKFTDYGPGYSAFEDGRLAGGFTTSATVRPCGVLVVLYATDLEATQAAVEAAGGKVVRAIFSFPGGRRFHFADPSGNELSVWSDQLQITSQ